MCILVSKYVIKLHPLLQKGCYILVNTISIPPVPFPKCNLKSESILPLQESFSPPSFIFPLVIQYSIHLVPNLFKQCPLLFIPQVSFFVCSVNAKWNLTDPCEYDNYFNRGKTEVGLL